MLTATETSPDLHGASNGLSSGVFNADYDRTVDQEIERFRQRAEEYLAGGVTEDDFRGFRLRHGVYGQRQPGVQMIRTKFPGGVLTAAQMDKLADVADAFAGGKGHLTTRQNMQYHFVKLAEVADLMHMLAEEGMTTREACFNTVRNVTACPKAGIAKDQIFDVLPYARKIAFAFLRKDLTDSMPRKFKIALDGCPVDCMLCAIHDVGLQARVADGKRGFRVLVGGGLGPLPTEAAVLDDFLPEERLINRIEAVLRVFNNYGNRKNRNKARLKFVLRERGFEWLKETIEKEYTDILANGGIAEPDQVPEGFGGYQSNPLPLGSGELLPVLQDAATDPEYDRWLNTNVQEQRQRGYVMITVRIDQGNLTSAQMRGLADLTRTAGDGLWRVTIEQNLLLGFVPKSKIRGVYAALKLIDLNTAGAGEAWDVVTCPGAYSCNLALTKSMNLGYAMRELLKGYDDPVVRALDVRISGCPNSCGQHWTGDFGFYGNARKIDGKEVPYYQMMLGGGYDREGIIRFGMAIQSIPARLAPEAVRRVLAHYLANRIESETFREYVVRNKIELFRQMTADVAKPIELFPEIYQDWGDDTAFSLQLGRGECAA